MEGTLLTRSMWPVEIILKVVRYNGLSTFTFTIETRASLQSVTMRCQLRSVFNHIKCITLRYVLHLIYMRLLELLGCWGRHWWGSTQKKGHKSSIHDGSIWWRNGRWKGKGSYNIRSNVSICCTELPLLPPPDTGIDENNLVARKPRGDLKCRESSGR